MWNNKAKRLSIVKFCIEILNKLSDVDDDKGRNMLMCGDCLRLAGNESSTDVQLNDAINKLKIHTIK